MLEIFVINNTNENLETYEKIARQLIINGIKILNKDQENLTLTLQFVDDVQALELNQQYRNKNYIPDVLSFPTDMSENEIKAIGYRELGDIVISMAEAKRKAIKYRHPLETEVAFLIVHGFLHLLGFDHETNQTDEDEMFAWQDKILASENYKYEIQDF